MQDIFDNIVKIITKYWHIYLDGAVGTLSMSAIAVLAGSVLGIFIAILKMSKLGFKVGDKKIRPFSLIATFYIEVIRGTPLMVQMMFFYFAIPLIFEGAQTNINTSIIVSLVLNSAGYMSEIIRAGIEAVDKGQTEAARSLGLSGGSTMLRIVLPQAVKNILPAMCNEFITIIKETAIVSTFFGRDIMTAYKTVQGFTYLSIEPLVVAAMIYFVLTFVLSKTVAAFERRLKASD